MDYSQEKSVEHLRGVAQALHDENLRLRQERADMEAAFTSQAAAHARQAAEQAAIEAQLQKQVATLLEKLAGC